MKLDKCDKDVGAATFDKIFHRTIHPHDRSDLYLPFRDKLFELVEADDSYNPIYEPVVAAILEARK